MSLQRWVRGRARLAVDSLFCSSAPQVRRVGDRDSGWVIQTDPPPVVCYCAGVGLGISFEQQLAKITPRPVLVFDPSPTGIATMAKSDVTGLHFFPVGLAAEPGTVEFSPPKDPGEGSYSVAREGGDVVSFECWSLPAIMGKHGHSSIDLLKMDIEGFEYDIIDRFLDERIPIRQVCVEFHPWLRPGRTLKTIARLHRAGYRIIHKHRGDHTFVLKESRYRQLLQKS
ncbi:MAG TPA: FkbM family methyltransferase [Granulicella sp.]|nr:FkbM family methyltransferase [Granulicella sp.]